MQKIKWIGVLLFLMALIYGGHRLSAVVASNMVENQKVIVIDAGHGGDDPGKIGVNGSKEKEVNLLISKEIKRCLERAGIRVVMTREEDVMLGESKVKDMEERVRIIDSSDAVLAVSIHQNSFTSDVERGAQVFYYEESRKGEQAAEILQNHLKMLDQENRRKIKANNSYYVLKRTKIPTIIIECGFLSNREEAEKLVDEKYQKDLAQVICEGILAFVGQE